MHLVHAWQRGQEAEDCGLQSLLKIAVDWDGVEQKKSCAKIMDQVMKDSLSCYLALLSFDSKTRQEDRHTFTT